MRIAGSESRNCRSGIQAVVKKAIDLQSNPVANFE
jgi:hypothetical protein